MRRHRQRQRSRLRSVALEVRDGEVEWLVERGYLARNAADDPWEIGAAIGRLLDAMLK
jgi:hypothetical protein